MRRLVITDVHLGMPSFKNEEKLLNLIKQGWDEVIIGGDFYELLGFMSKHEIESKYKDIFDELKKCLVVWLNGNHDTNVGIDEYYFSLPNNKKVIITHGHKLDSPTSSFGVKLNIFLYNILGFEIRRMLKPFKNYGPLLDKLLKYYDGKCDTLIVGHTHSFLEKGFIKNCGDFLEHSSCIQIIGNEIKRVEV